MHLKFQLVVLVLFPSQLMAAVPYQCEEMRVASVCSDIIKNADENLPGFVRLAFHDCVGENGCNGCIDLSNGDNGGLDTYINHLERRYQADVKGIMSRADFWVLCSDVALVEGQRRSGRAGDADSLLLNMVYGRKDCDSEAPNQRSPTDLYPSPQHGFNDTTEYFATEFGLTSSETVALLGAHTLGRARPAASGYDKQWVNSEFSLDNTFYTDILNKRLNWTQVDLNGDLNSNTSHLQWSQRTTSGWRNLMFNSDICVAYDIHPDKDGRINKTYSELAPSAGYELVKIYANDNARWLTDFSMAYKKMIKKVREDITLVMAKPDNNPDVCTEPTASPSNMAESRGTALALSLQLCTLLLFLLSS
ncbi:putative ascorbate peroxidase [Watersipora subatra]|uniref:putative ascorbate peroxidase n=1 Tax=Watersipora subatra TaxID=2589382 RepID=UPI00355AFC69